MERVIISCSLKGKEFKVIERDKKYRVKVDNNHMEITCINQSTALDMFNRCIEALQNKSEEQ